MASKGLIDISFIITLRIQIQEYSQFWIIHNYASIQDTWVAQWLNICLQLRVSSWSSRIESHIGIPAGSLLLPLPMSLSLS